MRNSAVDLYFADTELDWVPPNLINGWTNYVTNGIWRNVGYTIDEFGWVVLRGLVANPGAITVSSYIFLLPDELLPSKIELYAQTGAVGGVALPLRVDIYPKSGNFLGGVLYEPITGGVVDYVCLSGMRWKPDKDLI